MAVNATGVPSALGPDLNKTISEAIGDDHKAIDAYADKLKAAGSLQEKVEWRNQFTWALARHAVSEELTMYPSMEKHLGQEGIDLAETDREQHNAVLLINDLFFVQSNK